MTERWYLDAIVLPRGEKPEHWWIDAGVLHAGVPLARDAAERLPGRFVLAGLVDAHSHLTLDIAGGAGTVNTGVGRALTEHLTAGVLAVRDVGGIAHLEAAAVEPMLKLARPHLEHLRESIPLAERLGVTVLAGTDMLGHGNLAGEVAALVRLGMSIEAALAAASTAPREYLGLPTFADGQPAELVTYADDPREDPAVLRRPVAIVHAGSRIR